MLSLYEGEVIDLKELAQGISFNFIEIATATSTFVVDPFVYHVPAFDCSEDFACTTVFKFYEVAQCARVGLLLYDEFRKCRPESIQCVKTAVAKIERPCYFQEFTKQGAKYLLIKPKIEEPFEILALNGSTVKDGPFFRVFGEGPYVFKARNILFKFDSKPAS